MSVNVRIPTILRNLTGGAAEVTAEGGTLREVIDTLDSAHPGIRDRVLDDGGKIRRFVNVYVGDEDVRFAQGLDTPTPAGTQVSVIPAVAGGSQRSRVGRSPGTGPRGARVRVPGDLPDHRRPSADPGPAPTRGNPEKTRSKAHEQRGGCCASSDQG